MLDRKKMLGACRSSYLPPKKKHETLEGDFSHPHHWVVNHHVRCWLCTHYTRVACGTPCWEWFCLSCVTKQKLAFEKKNIAWNLLNWHQDIWLHYWLHWILSDFDCSQLLIELLDRCPIHCIIWPFGTWSRVLTATAPAGKDINEHISSCNVCDIFYHTLKHQRCEMHFGNLKFFWCIKLQPHISSAKNLAKEQMQQNIKLLKETKNVWKSVCKNTLFSFHCIVVLFIFLLKDFIQ